MSLLTIIQDLCKRQNVPIPATVFGSADPQVRQMQGLLEEEGDDLSGRVSWQSLTREATWTTTALEDQGAVTTLTDDGFRYIKNQTIWDRSTRLPICGPLDSKDWQALKAVVATGPRYQWRIRGGHLLVNPSAVAGESWYFEYVSSYWILAVDGTTYKNRFTADTDSIVLPYNLCLQGLRWRWKKEKGFDYAEDFRTYENQVADAAGRDGGKPTLYADNDPMRGPKPGIWVSPYSSVP